MKFRFHTSVLPWLPTIWSSASAHQLCSARTLKVWSIASAIPLSLFCQRSDVPFSVLPLGQDFERSRPSSALVLPGLPNMGKSTSALHLCRDFQKCEVALPHFCSTLTAKDLKFRFLYFHSVRTSKDLVHLPHLFCQDFQIWVSKSTSAFHLCRDFQRCEVPLPHFCSALTAKDLKFRFLNFHSVRTSIDLVLLPHLFYQDFQIWVSPLPHFISAGTFEDVKLRFRTSALPWLPKILSSAFRTSARPGLERSRSSSTLVLPGLPIMDKSTSAFHHCRDFQRSEIPVPHFCFASSAKDVKFCFLSSAIRSCYAFPYKFVRLSRDESGKNRNLLIDFTVSQA